MALFTSGGGRLILYRPGKEPIDAPPVPIRYQLYKSVGHSSLATFELAASHLKTVEDQSWKGKMVAFRAANQTALDSIDTMDMSADERANQRTIPGAISSSWTRASAKALTRSRRFRITRTKRDLTWRRTSTGPRPCKSSTG